MPEKTGKGFGKVSYLSFRANWQHCPIGDTKPAGVSSNKMKTPEEQKFEHIVRRMQTDRSVNAPDDALRYVKNLIRARAGEQRVSVLERIAAVLRIDLAPGVAAFGERSGSASEARQMLFESGDNAVDMRITAATDGFEIRGQILGDGFEGSPIELKGNGVLVTSKTDTVSHFSLPAVSAGDYSLSVRGEGREIFIEKISLQ